jgi:UDP-N-acetylmuramate dehydrogenase
MIALQQNVLLKNLNTWRVGGTAEYFIEPETPEQLAVFLSQEGLRFSQITWLGLGSNVLIPDTGLAGIVICTSRLNKLTLLDSKLDSNLVYAEAGVPCAKLAKFCAKNHLAGGAFFAGIPGTVGGALAMNAGAFGGETWALVQEVDMINRAGEFSRKPANEFTYAYRHIESKAPKEQIEKLDELESMGFLAGIFRFEPADETADLQAPVRALLKKRNETQPIGTFNCGSVFRNPPGDHAARLIEFCGLKGTKEGGAVVSPKHANFIINEDNATAEEIYRLIKKVKKTVFQETGVTLIPEVKFLGWQGNSA